MISPEWVRQMARYNQWQNKSLYTAADALGEDERRADRGAFFGSIHQTLSHIAWGDQMWMSRLAGWSAPDGVPATSVGHIGDWEELQAARVGLDRDLIAWADSLGGSDLEGTLDWHSRAANKDFSTPLWICITHLFTHQVHHRGQVHAMLTAAGQRPDDTDLTLMPGISF